jgi:hypothetical protein
MYQKKPLKAALPEHTKSFIDDHDALIGKSMPCRITGFPYQSGSKINTSIVKVKFDVEDHFTRPEIIMPVAMARFVYFPLAIGDKGMALAVNADYGQMTGLGGGIPDASYTANLSGLVFVPIGNIEFEKVKNDLFTVLKAISDNAFKTTPTQLKTNGDAIIAKVNELVTQTNSAHSTSIQLLSNVSLASPV